MIGRLALAPLLVAAAPVQPLTIGDQAFVQSDVLDARGLPEIGGGASILITLTPAAAKRLAALAHAHVGDTLTIAVDGVVIAQALMRDEMTDGVLQVTGDFTLSQASAFAKRIAGRDPAPDSLEE